MLSPRGSLRRAGRHYREKSELIDRTLDALARFCLRRPKQIIWISFVCALLALAAASRLSFDPDLLNLIPQNNKSVNEFRKVLRVQGTIDYHIVTIEVP